MDLTHIHPEFREKAKLSDQQRIEFIYEPRWIGYPKANNVIKTMYEYMSRPSRPRTVGLLLTGESNNGKTTIINRFNDLYGERYTDSEDNPVVPVMIIQAPSTPDEKSLYAAIIEQLWSPYKITAPLIKLRYQAVHLMRLCQVKILIIDEIHSMFSGSAIKRQQVMNGIKSLSNELRIPIVAVGTKLALNIIQIDKQHASRFDIMTLHRWKTDVSFQKLLVDFESMLPLRTKSNLKENKKASLLHYISKGNIGDLHRLLMVCTEDAIKTGKECIDIETINKFKARKKTEKQKSIEIEFE